MLLPTKMLVEAIYQLTQEELEQIYNQACCSSTTMAEFIHAIDQAIADKILPPMRVPSKKDLLEPLPDFGQKDYPFRREEYYEEDVEGLVA